MAFVADGEGFCYHARDLLLPNHIGDCVSLVFVQAANTAQCAKQSFAISSSCSLRAVLYSNHL